MINAFDFGFDQGWTGMCRFDTPGTYSLTCDAHAFETGTIIVQPK